MKSEKIDSSFSTKFNTIFYLKVRVESFLFEKVWTNHVSLRFFKHVENSISGSQISFHSELEKSISENLLKKHLKDDEANYANWCFLANS
jgi:hypothetical protein